MIAINSKYKNVRGNDFKMIYMLDDFRDSVRELKKFQIDKINKFCEIKIEEFRVKA